MYTNAYTKEATHSEYCTTNLISTVSLAACLLTKQPRCRRYIELTMACKSL